MWWHERRNQFVFRRNGWVHLNRRGQFSRLLAAEVCASAVVMLDTPCSETVRRVLATHSIHQFLLHFPSRASPCAITFNLEFGYKLTATAQNLTFRILDMYWLATCSNDMTFYLLLTLSISWLSCGFHRQQRILLYTVLTVSYSGIET